MTIDSSLPDKLRLVLAVERFYAVLIQAAIARSAPDSEPSLGGQLLYAGLLDGDGSALLLAANIAGAASLAATSDSVARKQAIRNGAIDFLVTSLDEALRILKNEIRKRETVAVCVAAAPEAVERAMRERGVLPDLLRPGTASTPELAAFLSQGARRIELPGTERNQTLVAWSVAAAPALWLPKLDAIALDCLRLELGPAALAARRWLRLAPRYLGRLAQGARLLRCNEETAQRFLAQARESVEGTEIGVPVEMLLIRQGQPEQHRISPPRTPQKIL